MCSSPPDHGSVAIVYILKMVALLLRFIMEKKTPRDSIKDAKYRVEESIKELSGTLGHALAPCPFLPEVLELITDAVERHAGNMVFLNADLIRSWAELLGLSTKIIISSDIGVTSSSKTKRLADITRNLGGTHYLSALGSREYIIESGEWPEDLDLSFFDPIIKPYDQPKSGLNPTCLL